MTGIFYGSTTGNTEELASAIADKLGVSSTDMHNVDSTSADSVAQYDMILLGSSTWGSGELQDDWYGFLKKLKIQNITGKKVGLFGCGDSSSYPDTFCDAIGLIQEELSISGCVFVGQMDADDYSVTDSLAFASGKVKGLAADDDEPNKTAIRLDRWIKAIESI